MLLRNIIMQKLLFNCYKTTNKCTHVVRITIMFYHANCYMLQAYLAHHKGVHIYKKQSSKPLNVS